MRLLARYLLRECLVALAYCFSAFLILWVTLDLMSSLHDMQENKLHAGDVVEFYLFRLPEFLPIALPVAL
jgi:lipopolysaccharide export LptBFGC system permease protein LptF